MPLRRTRPVWLIIFLASTACLAQESSQRSQPSPSAPQDPTAEIRHPETKLQSMRDLPIVWLIGPYIPPTGPLQPLTNAEREEVYFRQTFLTAGTYIARMFTAGIDQARDVPYQWGGGGAAYGQRFGSRYGQFVIANTFHSIGNGALGYESRYDICRCTGFWPRTKHAIARNFVTYNRTERELRPQIPLYVGSFGAGMISTAWLPGKRNVWKEGTYSALVQCAIGSGYNVVSEFAFDILRKLGVKKR